MGRPITGLPPVGKRTGFKAWSTDERLGTFILTRGEDPPMRDDLCHLTVLDAAEKDDLGETNTERKVKKLQDWGLLFVNCPLCISNLVPLGEPKAKPQDWTRF